MRSLVLLEKQQLCSASNILSAVFYEDTEPLLCVYEAGELQIRHREKVLATHACAAQPSRLFLSYLASRGEVSLVTAEGEICTFRPEESDVQELEVAGDIEGGISAASWSPEEDCLALATHNGKLLLLDSAFELLSEVPLRPAEYGSDVPISVGWGDKTTQFHGSIGKGAARQERQERPTDWLDATKDSAETTISWRGDGAHFCVSTRDQDNQQRLRRVLRFYSRSGELQNTSEATPGMEDAMAWQPSGSIIASVQRTQTENTSIARDVIFFERNGLRRYEFSLMACEDHTVHKLTWNCDSSFLAVLLTGADGLSKVRLYTRRNYQWYLKHQTPPFERLVDISWHAEDPLQLLVVSSGSIESLRFASRTIGSQRPAPHDTGLVASIDGSASASSLLLLAIHQRAADALLSSLGRALIPPPMCETRITAKSPLCDVAFDATSNTVATLDCEGHVALWNALSTSKPFAERHFAKHARQMALVSRQDGFEVAVLVDEHRKGVIVRAAYKGGSWSSLPSHAISSGWRLFAAADHIILQDSGGTCNIFAQHDSSMIAIPLAEACNELFAYLSSTQVWTICGLSAAGRMHMSGRTAPISSNCTSLALCGDMLLYTTSSSELHFINLQEPHLAISPRSVERGSRLVTCVPSKMLAVLQMPRGNLESICPRPLVHAHLRDLLAEKRYGLAFAVCRKHRIDLNVLCDHDEAVFLSSIDQVLTEISAVDDVNLLLTSLSDHDASPLLEAGEAKPTPSPGKANRILDAFLEAFDSQTSQKRVHCVLTALIRKQPPAYEAALQILSTLRDQEDALQDAVSYMFFLVPDADKLYEAALSMYDLKMALLVAQHSQKDPKEFLPFLRELQALDPRLRRFRIDDVLKQYEKALSHLVELDSPDAFAQATAYVVRHELYDVAVRLFSKQPARLREILDLRGNWNIKRGRASEAALDFALALNRGRQLEALRSSLMWRELFALLLSAQSPKPAKRSYITALAIEIADELAVQKRHTEAARVRLDYGQDIPGAIIELCHGSEWSEALRLSGLYGRSDLLASSIAPAAMEAVQGLLQSIEDMAGQASKQVTRLDELQRNREMERIAEEEEGNDVGDGFEVASDDSTAVMSQFTRYTAAASTGAFTGSSAQSGNSARSRRKHALKQLAGKRNTIHEDTYIFNSLVKIATDRLEALQLEARPLLLFCLELDNSLNDTKFRSRAANLQTALTELEERTTDAIQQAWDETRDEAATKVRPERPTVSTTPWRIELLDLLL